MRFDHTFELLQGHKTQTSRVPAFRYYNWYKDVNINPRRTDAEGPNGEKLPIMLKFCTIKKLRYVRDHDYWKEGFSSAKAFEDIWVKLYGKFDPNLDVCVLEFDVLTAKIIYR
jgi:hypothetical protein